MNDPDADAAATLAATLMMMTIIEVPLSILTKTRKEVTSNPIVFFFSQGSRAYKSLLLFSSLFFSSPPYVERKMCARGICVLCLAKKPLKKSSFGY